MRLRWTGLRRPDVPDDVAAAIAPVDGERLLAWAVEERHAASRWSRGASACMP